MTTLFIADDNPDMLEIMVSILGKDFKILGTASCGGEILRRVPELNPRVVLLDISLGDMSGFEVVEKLRDLGAKALFVFVSVHEGSAFVQAARNVGASGYVFKARMASDLVRTLKGATEEGVIFRASERYPMEDFPG